MILSAQWQVPVWNRQMQHEQENVSEDVKRAPEINIKSPKELMQIHEKQETKERRK